MPKQTGIDMRESCADLMRMVTQVASLKLSQILEFVTSEHNEHIATLERQLAEAREVIKFYTCPHDRGETAREWLKANGGAE